MTIVANPRSSPVSIRRNEVEFQDGASLLRGRTTTVDGQVTYAYRTLLAGAFPRGMALVAVGGYGRRELFPHSDIDLLLLVDKELQSDEQRTGLSVFLRSLWDGNLRLSQSVRTIAECTKFDTTNVELAISLLDARFLIGDSELFEQLADRLPKFFRSQRQSIAQKLCEMTQARHLKFDNTISHLEPNIKEGPGGLRDLHVVGWLSKLRETPPAPDPALDNAAAFLFSVRAHLHTQAGRDSNVLTFDMQEEMSPDPAVWMREFFRHARVIHRSALGTVEACEGMLSSGLIRSFRDWRSRLSNTEISVIRDRVMLRSPQNLFSDALLLFRLFEFVGRHGIPLSIDTERRIREGVTARTVALPDPAHQWSALKTVLSQPHAALALHGMDNTGLLGLLLPAWKTIECLVIRDFYHRYTVDEHTLITISHIDRLRTGSDPTRRRFTEMLSETQDPALLVIALIFHDVGKSDGLSGHAQASAREASTQLTCMGMPEEERLIVEFLVEHHLDISAVINSRDLSDPATAVDLATRVETLEKLRYLTLLTYADISAVNPDAMTPWRLEQLWHAYLAGHRELTRELDTDRIHARQPDHKSDWLEGFPVRYLRTHSGSQIDSHMQLASEAKETGAAVEIVRRSGAWHLTVVSKDRPGLLAGLAGAVSSFGMNIVRVEAFANNSGWILDSLMFEDPMRTLELNAGEADRLRQLVRKVLLGKEDVDRLLRGRARPQLPTRAARILPAVFFDNEASASSTLVEIVAQDRPALFYDLARTFSAYGCSIEVVLIDTEAHKAIDVFYVTHQRGKIPPELQSTLQGELLQVCAS